MSAVLAKDAACANIAARALTIARGRGAARARGAKNPWTRATRATSASCTDAGCGNPRSGACPARRKASVKPPDRALCRAQAWRARPAGGGAGPGGAVRRAHAGGGGLRGPWCSSAASAWRSARATWRRFWAGGALDPESNVQFGEGGAGAFSDGKLNTGMQEPAHRARGAARRSMHAARRRTFCIMAHPHVGTDRLARRGTRHPGENPDVWAAKCCSSSRLIDLVVERRPRRAAREFSRPRRRRRCPWRRATSTLAVGHSARDAFEMLHAHGRARWSQKPFSIGRAHRAQTGAGSTRAQYGPSAGHPALGAADYRLSAHLGDGRAAYTFCMCPGGSVVAAASEAGGTS